jgi:hypothetical protein
LQSAATAADWTSGECEAFRPFENTLNTDFWTAGSEDEESRVGCVVRMSDRI